MFVLTVRAGKLPMLLLSPIIIILSFDVDLRGKLSHFFTVKAFRSCAVQRPLY